LLPKRYAYEDLLDLLEGFAGQIERGEDSPAQKRKY
jgi:hypothetical protein